MCDTEESTSSTAAASMASNDPVISRIKRDVERKQEFLRATHLPNYLASPTSNTTTSTAAAVIQQQPSAECQPQQIVQGVPQQPVPQPHPVYFGDRFPVHQPRGDEVAESEAAISAAAVGGPGSRSGVASQFHLYGLPLGKNYYFLYVYIYIYI